MILAGDIGGTHTRLALFQDGVKKIEKKYASPKYPGLEQIIQEFLAENKEKVSKACFGIAGPVRNGICKATNLPWIVDAQKLQKILGISKVGLLNDLEANAHGLEVLKKEELFLLQKGDPSQKGNRALISAGTGLGEAGLYWDGKVHHPFACEGGHSDFAPRDEKEFALFLYLQKQFGHVSYERVVSGPGLVAILRFLVETKQVHLSRETESLMKEKAPARVISELGAEGRDSACSAALDWFLSFYGAEAGNLALKILSLGGLYLGGGIAPRIVDRLKTGPFLKAFLDKGRFHVLLESIPIWIVLNDDAALLGAAKQAAILK